MGSPGGSTEKNLTAKQEIWVQSLGRDDPLESEMATHSSILDQKIQWTEKPGRLQSMGSQWVRPNSVTEQQSPLYSMETWKTCRNVVNLHSRRQPYLCYLLKKKKKDWFVHKALSLKDNCYELRCLILDIGLLFRTLLRNGGYTESEDLVTHRKIQPFGGEKCR